MRTNVLETTTGHCYGQSVSSVPPADPKDERSAMPWSSERESGASSKGSTLVGSVIDPSVDDDGLSLTGPGAPTQRKKGAFSNKSEEHPVRARLLERARRAREGLPADDEPLSPRTASATAPVEGEPAPNERVSNERVSNERVSNEQTPNEGTLDEPSRADSVPEESSADGVPPGAPQAGNARADETRSSALPQAEPGSPATPSPSGDALVRASVPAPSVPPPSVPPPTPSVTDPTSTSSRLPPVQPAPRAVVPSAPPPPIVADGDELPPARPPAATPPPGAIASELDQFARRAARSDAGPRLSPNMTAALGGLVGITVVVTLGLFLSKTSVDGPSAAPRKQVAAPVAEEKEPKEPKKPERKKIEGPWRIKDDANKPGHTMLSGRIGKQAFLRAIQDAGLPKSEAYRAYGALKSELDLDHCSSRDTFLALVKGRDKSLVAFEYIKSKEEVYQVKANQAGHMEAKALDLKVTRNQIRRAFVHDGKSFEESARRGGFDPGITSTAEDALRGHATLSDFKRGDRIKIIAQEVTVLGEFSRYAGIEAMEILRPGEESRRIYYYAHPVEGGHFDKNGRAPYEGGWRKPIPDAPRTSKFNPTRMHPVLKRVLPHNGTDFGAPAGTPIGATAPGVVTFIGAAGRSGNLVKVKHHGGYESGYAHMSRFAENLKVGDSVDRLQLVGYCGSTGSSTAPHLHFSMKKDGVFIDPESLNLDGLRVLPKDHRSEFALVRQKYDPILDEIPSPTPLPSADSDLGQQAAQNGLAEQEQEQDDNPMADEEDAQGDAPEGSADGDAERAAQRAAPSPAGAPAKSVAPKAIFLSDAELLRMQSLTDDGEVRE